MMVIVGIFLLGLVGGVIPGGAFAWEAEVVLQSDRQTAQPGEQVEVSIFAKVILEAGEQVVGLTQYELVWELEGLTYQSARNNRVVIGRFLYRDANIEASRDGNNTLFENCPRTSASFFEHPQFGPLERPLATVKPGDTDPSCLLGPFETLILSVDGPVGSTATVTIVPSRGILKSVILSAVTGDLATGPALKYPTGGGTDGSFPVDALGDPVVIRVVEQTNESQLVLEQPAIPGVLGTVDNIDEPNAVHVLNVQLVDGDGAGNGDSFPSPVVTSFTMVADVSVDAFTFELRNGSNAVLVTSVGNGSGAVKFDGLDWQVPDGQASPMFAVYAYKSRPGGDLIDGQEITFSIGNTLASVAIEATTTLTSRLSGMSSEASFSIDVQAVQVVIGGSETWDLSAPYALSTTGTIDAQGRLDSNFSLSDAIVEARVGDDTQPWVPVAFLQPVGSIGEVSTASYTADRDRVPFALRARIGSGLNSTLFITVDVVADNIVSTVLGASILDGVSNPVDLFELRAVKDTVVDTDVDVEVAVSCATDPLPGIESCAVDSAPERFIAGVYSGVVAATVLLEDASVSAEVTLFADVATGVSFVAERFEYSFTVLNCSGKGLTLRPGASDEIFFEVAVGGMLCGDTADYDIYYYDALELGQNCSTVLAAALISSATAAAQVQRVALSVGNSTATISNVTPDTRYCVVAQVSGSTASSSVTEVNTIVVATLVEIDGPPVWDLTAPYMLRSTGTDGQGRLDGNFADAGVTVEARLGDDTQPWVLLEDILPTGEVPTAAYTADTDGVAFALRARIGDGQNSTLNLSVDVTAVALMAGGDIEVLPVDTGVVMVAQVVNAVDINGVIDGDYAGDLAVEHDADGSVDLPVMSTVTVVVIQGSFIAAGVSALVLRVEVEAAMFGDQNLPVISLLLEARDSLGQELMPATVSFEFLLGYDFDFDADGVLDDEDAGILFLWFNNRRLAALGTPEFLLRPAIRAPRNWISADMAPDVVVRLQQVLVTDDVSGYYRFDALDFDASGVLGFEDAAILSLWSNGRGSLGTRSAQQILARAISMGWIEASEADAVVARLRAVVLP